MFVRNREGLTVQQFGTLFPSDHLCGRAKGTIVRDSSLESHIRARRR
jgi:hypothetical protein